MDVQDSQHPLLIITANCKDDELNYFQCDVTTSRTEQERLQLERFELLSTANELRQQLRQCREGAAAMARSAETSPVVGMYGSLKASSLTQS